MPNEVTTTEETTAPAPKAPRTHAEQDRGLTKYVVECEQVIAASKRDSALLAELARLGIDAAEIALGEQLVATAQAKIAERQLGMGSSDGSHSDILAKQAIVSKRLSDFRAVARLAFPSAAAQKSLGVSGNKPKDRKEMISQLRTCLAAARIPMYSEGLARCSYDAAEIAAALAEVNALDQACAAQETAARDAKAATASRNEAIQELRTWRTRFSNAVRLAYKRMSA